MENGEMGSVTTKATIFNLHDVVEARLGNIPESAVRKVVIEDALVDTGATTLALPKPLIEKLGLVKRYEKQGRSEAGIQSFNVYDAVRVDIMGREATVDPIEEVPEENPTLIGQIPLEMMDWVVDLQGRRLMGNPEHNGEHFIDMF